MAAIQKRAGPNGTSRFRVQVRKDGCYVSKTFARHADAKAWAAAEERKIDLGALAPVVAAGTVGELIDRYEKELEPHQRWGRSKAYELAMLRRDLGDQPLPWITRQSAIEYGRDLQRTLAGPGIATRLGYLREVMRAAADLWGMRTPAPEVTEAIDALRRLKVIGRGEPRTRRVTQAEIQTLMAYAGDQSGRAVIDLGAIIRTLAIVPLRIGELTRIEWTDLDKDRRTVVLRARKHPDSRVREGNNQIVPLPRIDGLDTFELIAGRPRELARPFPWEAHSVSSAFWLAVKTCGLADLHLHDLRAGAISVLLERGIPIPQVALISGHRDWKVLARHYSRLDPVKVGQLIETVTATKTRRPRKQAA